MKRGATMQDLVLHVRDNLVKERPELFSVDGTVCVFAAWAGPRAAGGTVMRHWRVHLTRLADGTGGPESWSS